MGDCIGRKDGVVARKLHHCWWCGVAIVPGEAYSRWAWADQGEITTVRAHAECALAWSGCYDEDAAFGEHNRGCECERGRCECGKAMTAEH